MRAPAMNRAKRCAPSSPSSAAARALKATSHARGGLCPNRESDQMSTARHLESTPPTALPVAPAGAVESSPTVAIIASAAMLPDGDDDDADATAAACSTSDEPPR